MADLVDTAAQAISRTMEEHRPKRIIRGADQDYEECQAGCRYEPGYWSAHISKLLAQAAINALGLTPEYCARSADGDLWEWSCGHERSFGNPDHIAVYCALESGDTIDTRLVSPWVRTGGDDA